ncbi:hypothetical protein VQ643_09525 [Pseudomonas sp. F1_0610]|uniref:hypothetical protein n=1 Tax=Pseudomonas sp. F1_0610 TaxID=3114284 RepID=UPI0039C33E7A
METAAKRLADVREAIREVNTYGQSVRKDGRELRRADLATLHRLEQQYLREVALEKRVNRGAPRSRIYYGVL